MRIISDFHDYYDSAMGFGQDPNLKYVRKQETFEFPARSREVENRMPRNLDQILRIPLENVRKLPHFIQDRFKYPPHILEIPITTKIIGFCGVLYASIEIAGTTFYATDQIVSHLSDEFLHSFGIDQKGLETLLLMKVPHRWRDWYWSRDAKSLTCESWERASAEFSGKHLDEVFIGLGVPPFKLDYIALNKRGTCDTIRCTLNPHLRAEAFQKIKPPAEAFQEISMYLGNQLARQSDPVSVFPDEIMRDEKGFGEWSFRRHKEEDKKYKKKEGAD